MIVAVFFFSSRRRHTRLQGDWSSDVCSSDLSLALHYRRAPRLGGYAHRLMRSLAARIGSQYCVQTGKRIVEMKPAGKDKGVAVLEFMQEEPFRGRTPVFIGDDTTDEYGFATVNRLHGHSVKVGAGRTVAHWRLRDVDAGRAWLAAGPRKGAPLRRSHPPWAGNGPSGA